MSESLKFIKKSSTTSATSSLEVTDCFSDSYDVYKVIFEMNSMTAEGVVAVRLIDGSGVDSTANYDYAIKHLKDTTASSESRVTGNTSWNNIWYGEGSVGGFVVMYVHNPYNSSSHTFMNYKNTGHYLASSTSTMYGGFGIGVHRVAEQITGIAAIQTSSRLENANILVYGVE
mgnify:CR=1 FL=1